MTVIGTQDGWTLSRTPSEDEYADWVEIIQLHAPLWEYQMRMVEPDEHRIRQTADLMQDELIENILNNPPVNKEIKRRYVPKEKVREILDKALYFGIVDFRTVQDILEED